MTQLLNSKEKDSTAPKRNDNNDSDSKITKEISDRLQILFDYICHDILLKLDVSTYDIEPMINKSWPLFDQKFEPSFNIAKESASKYFQSFSKKNPDIESFGLTLVLDIFEQNCHKYKELIAIWTNDLCLLKNYFLYNSIKELSKIIIDRFNLSEDDFKLITDKHNNSGDLFLAKSLQSDKSISIPLKSNHPELKELKEKISKVVSESEERLLFGFKLEERSDHSTNTKFIHKNAQDIAIYEELGKKDIYIYQQITPNKDPDFIKKLFGAASQEDIDKISQLKGSLLIKLQDSESTVLLYDQLNKGFHIINKDLSCVELLCTDKGFSYKSEYLRNLPTDTVFQSSSSPDIKIKSKLQLALREHISSSIIKESLSNSDHELPYNELTYPYSEIPNRSKEDTQSKLKLSDTFWEFEAKCSTIYGSTSTPSIKRKIPVDYMDKVDQAPSKQPKLNDSATSKPSCARMIDFTATHGRQDNEKLAKSSSKIIELLLQKEHDSSKLTENHKSDSIKALYRDSTDHKSSTQTQTKIDETWISKSWEHDEYEMTIDNY